MIIVDKRCCRNYCTACGIKPDLTQTVTEEVREEVLKCRRHAAKEVPSPPEDRLLLKKGYRHHCWCCGKEVLIQQDKNPGLIPIWCCSEHQGKDFWVNEQMDRNIRREVSRFSHDPLFGAGELAVGLWNRERYGTN